MILTDSQAMADRARVLRAHGMSVSDLARHQANRVITEEYQELGYNYRMSDLHAAVGVEQMKKLDTILSRRRQLAQRYNDAFVQLDCVQIPFSPPLAPHTYQSYMIQLKPHAPKERNQVMQEMLQAGIATRPGVMGIHMSAYYTQRFPGVRLPVTENATRTTILLPLYPSMTDAEQEYVIDTLVRLLT